MDNATPGGQSSRADPRGRGKRTDHDQRPSGCGNEGRRNRIPASAAMAMGKTGAADEERFGCDGRPASAIR